MSHDFHVLIALATTTLLVLGVWLPWTVRRQVRRDQRAEAMRRHVAGGYEQSAFTERNRR